MYDFLLSTFSYQIKFNPQLPLKIVKFSLVEKNLCIIVSGFLLRWLQFFGYNQEVLI